ncbi:MAG: molybdopterin-containing oxidoreductase family protein [Omnitrophica WOR_2 bacterium]
MKTRREFIKISALGIGAAAIATQSDKWNLGLPLFAAEINGKTNKGVRLVPTYCEVCFWKCAAWAHVDENGKILKLTGNNDDPQCNGRLCPRGTGGIGMVYDDDRLKTPLIRVEKNGKQTYRQASWEEALDLIASRMKEIAAKNGPESIALFNHGSPGTQFSHLLKSFGSSTITAPSFAQCRGPRETGFETTFGSQIGSPEPTDIRDTRCLVLIGSHIGENMHNAQVQEFSDAIDKGATIITVDPRLSIAANKSKYWLPIKPATDIALLLSWIHVLVFDELYNKAYVAKHTMGLEQLKEHVRPFTPEWAYGITTIEPSLIRTTAKEIADAAPSVIIHPGRHVTWYGDDAQRSRAIAILNGLLGSWGARGGFFMKEGAGIPEFPHPEFPKPAWSWHEVLNGKYPFASMSVSNSFIDASIISEENKYPIKAWFIAGTNLPMAIPLKSQIMKALQDLEFVVVVDTMPTEVTGFADVVLPECTYLERYDELRDAPHRVPTMALRMPVIDPMWDSKPAWWITKQIGERLGLHEFYNYNDFEEVIKWQLEQKGYSFEELKNKGVIVLPRKNSSPYIDPSEDYKFNTPSGKIEFYSSSLAAAGFDPIPVYTPHPEPEQGFYRLIYGRAPMHTFSRTANNANLTDLMHENSLWVHPKVAALWGLEEGKYTYLKNQDGITSDFPIKIRVTERIRWDSVYMVHGFGHNRKELSRAFGKGANDTELITNVMIDPLMGGTGMRGNFVTFTSKASSENKEVAI